ncbi:hypothetical protein GCM10012319_24470 [Comamonas sp. KCTC 72670]|nr:hypothetical protein GCM10012319_24470 [Comamonas sp. KCTC 72670]
MMTLAMPRATRAEDSNAVLRMNSAADINTAHMRTAATQGARGPSGRHQGAPLIADLLRGDSNSIAHLHWVRTLHGECGIRTLFRGPRAPRGPYVVRASQGTWASLPGVEGGHEAAGRATERPRSACETARHGRPVQSRGPGPLLRDARLATAAGPPREC